NRGRGSIPESGTPSAYTRGMAPPTPRTAGLCCLLSGLCLARAHAQEQTEFPCRPVTCSTLLPSTPVDDAATNDCGYRAGNLWWVDYVAGSLAWSHRKPAKPIIVAVFDDGAYIDHEDLRNQLWTNEAELKGKPGVDDDGNGYVDDLHGWDF